MERALATFLTALYVIVDDFYQRHLRPQRPVWGGPPALMRAREGLCLGLAAPWRRGVPGKRARGSMREVRTHLRPWCPTLRTPRACNRRRRRLWGAFLLLQDAVAAARAPADADDVLDGCPLPVAPGARSFPRAAWPPWPASAKAAMTALALACAC